MKRQLANDEIIVDYGGSAVVLRPSLRAAVRLERLHGGFPELLRKIEEFDTLTVWHVITAGAGREATDALFAHAAHEPLGQFQRAAQGACLELVAGLFPVAPEGEHKGQKSATPMPWSELFGHLYGYATGWLGWSPEAAWAATPQEITDAFEAHVEKLKAIYGEAEEVDEEARDAQRCENEALGLDPEFDRAGLQRLKALSKLKEGQQA